MQSLETDIYLAFLELSEARPAGMGFAPLPPSEIEAWLNLTGITGRRAFWTRCIRSLDRVWLPWRRAQG